ncbi:MAG TPA: PAS domain S-box protein, partial [Terriglobales bacterium]|nr:PAS domain S-box protein [Terriglobales bacterium]
PQDVFKFAFLAGVVSTLVSATIGVTSLVAGGQAGWAEYGPIWQTWWLGDMVGDFVVAPFLLLWGEDWRTRWKGRQVVEAALLIVSLLLVGGAVFDGLRPGSGSYLCIPVLIWAAFRFGPREAATASLLLSAIAIWGTLRGFGPFAGESPNESLLLLQTYMGVVTVMVIAVAVVVRQQKIADQTNTDLLARLRGQRERVDNIVSTVPGVVWEAWGQPNDRAQQINFVSDHVETMLGYTVGHWLSSPNFWLSIVHPDDRERAAQEAAAIFQSGKGGVSQFRWVAKDGRVLWVEARSAVVCDAAGVPIGMRGVTMDITDRKRAEEERAHLAAIVESSDDAIISKTLDGAIVSWNPGAEKLYGYSATEALGKPISILIPRGQPDELPAIIEKLKAGERIEDYETVRQRKDGSQVEVSVTISPIRDDAGRITGASSVARDITERRRVERDLQQQTTLIQLAQEAILVRDPHGTILKWNAGAAELYGWTEAEAIGKVSHTLLQTKSAADVDVDDALARRSRWEGELIHTRRDGREIVVESRQMLARGEDGSPIGVLEVNRDITDRKRAEEERVWALSKEQKARQEAEAANRAKDEFLATLSHELRTPLTAILGWARLLRSDSHDPEVVANGLEKIERNAKAQARLIDDILDVSRIITGKLRLDVGVVDFSSVVEAALESVRPAADANNIRLGTALDRGLVAGDANRLQQVAWNLLSNAVKFTPKGGQVDVSLRRVDAHIELSVKDNGKGITAEFLPHVFDRFRQADGSNTRVHSGLGLGLAIVRHIIELHGGSVRAESPGQGHGATFTVLLPVMEAEAQPRSSRPSRRAVSHPGLKGLHVLVVDDDRDTRALLAAILESSGVTVTVADSVRKALRVLRSSSPDMLISDIAMPGESGFALIRQLRDLAPEDGGSIPAVALTGYVSLEERVRVLAAGYQAHVPKPVEPDELLTLVASLVGRARSG